MVIILQASKTALGNEDPLPPPGKIEDLLGFVGKISLGDLKKIEAAIQENFEKIDPSDW